MAKYRITRQYIYLQDIEVDADNVNKAMDTVLAGGGKKVGEPRYSYAYDDIDPCDVINLDTGESGDVELYREA